MSLRAVLIFFVMVAVIFSASFVSAWQLHWDGSEGATGYKVHYCEVSTPEDVTTVDVGAELKFDLPVSIFVNGTRYQFYCTAYNAETSSLPSDILRWTACRTQIIIETIGAPVTIRIIP